MEDLHYEARSQSSNLMRQLRLDMERAKNDLMETFKIINGKCSINSESFLSRVSTLTRDIDIAILSVRPSVTRWYCIKTAERIAMALKDPKLRFQGRAIFDAIYLQNGCRYGHSYCGRRMGNRTQAFKWYCFNDIERPLT